MSKEFPHLPPVLTEWRARAAVVLGSGLGPFVDSLTVEAVVPYATIPGLPVSTAPGHAGRFVLVRCAGRPLLIAQGRVHLYEGWEAREVSRAIRLFHHLGIERLILTNAAGALNPAFTPGNWMMLTDHINLTGHSPLRGGPNFFDMSEVYSRRLQAIFRTHAAASGLPLAEGVYVAVPGPQYETPAEIRMLQRLGADAVGMSTVHEAIQARALGLEIAAFSCLTNWGAGLSAATLHHEEVTAMGRRSAGALAGLLEKTLPEIA